MDEFDITGALPPYSPQKEGKRAPRYQLCTTSPSGCASCMSPHQRSTAGAVLRPRSGETRSPSALDMDLTRAPTTPCPGWLLACDSLIQSPPLCSQAASICQTTSTLNLDSRSKRVSSLMAPPGNASSLAERHTPLIRSAKASRNVSDDRHHKSGSSWHIWI